MKLLQTIFFTSLFVGAVWVCAYIAPTPLTTGNIDDPVWKYATSTSKWITNSAVTVAEVARGRSFLEISNITGATSTAQAVYCAVGATPVAYQGIVIQASSTRSWNRDTIPVGQVKCILPTGGGTVTVVEK